MEKSTENIYAKNMELSYSLSSLVPRLFLIEERAWQHWGVGAVYFRYVMVHVIYSDHALFLKLSCDFCEGT